MWRLAALSAVVAFAASDVCEDDGVCLLSLRQQVRSVASEFSEAPHFKELFLQVRERRAVLADWQRRTESLRTSVFADPSFKGLIKSGGMDDFIKAQEGSDDACHSKQLEAKRSLDGLLHTVKELSAEIEAETAVVTGNTETLEDALDKKKEATDKKTQCNDVCDKKNKEDLKYELGKIQEELDEMKNIANPEVRSGVKFDVDYAAEAKKAAEEERKKAAAAVGTLSEKDQAKVLKDQTGKTALLQTGHQMVLENLAAVVMDAGKCQAFAAAVARVEEQHHLGLERSDCDDKRAELQKEFTKAYLAIADMYDRKNQEIKEELDACKEKCEGDFEEKDEVVKGQIKAATEAIAKAKDTLEDLEPMLEAAKKSLAKLREHVDKMEKSCEIGGDVSEHLKKIRELITALDECPGKNDFKLDIPEWTPKTPSLIASATAAKHASPTR